MKRLITALKKITADDDDDDDALYEALKFMKENGLAPTGKGKPTKPSRAVPHSVAYDPDFDIYYVITDLGNRGEIWMIDTKGKTDFVSTYKGDFKPQRGVEVFNDGEYHDYAPLKVMQAIFDIVDPEWSEPESDEERESMN